MVSALLLVVAALLAQMALASGEGEGGTSVITGLVNKLVLFAWGGLGAAFGPAILLALYDRRMTGLAALTAMVTGGATAIVWKGWVKPAMNQVEDAPAWWPWVSYELTVAFPLALLVGFAVSRLLPGRHAESTGVRA